MKMIISSFLLLFFLILTARAENYPYRSDVLWVTVPSHADWLYKTGEQASVEVQFYKYGIPQDGVQVDYEIGGDMMPADTRGSVKLKNGKQYEGRLFNTADSGEEILFEPEPGIRQTYQRSEIISLTPLKETE